MCICVLRSCVRACLRMRVCALLCNKIVVAVCADCAGAGQVMSLPRTTAGPPRAMWREYKYCGRIPNLEFVVKRSGERENECVVGERNLFQERRSFCLYAHSRERALGFRYMIRLPVCSYLCRYTYVWLIWRLAHAMSSKPVLLYL